MNEDKIVNCNWISKEHAQTIVSRSLSLKEAKEWGNVSKRTGCQNF